MDRRQADVRREEILRATARIVAKKGFARTRVADVATALGISSGLVFYHFDTKERLLSEAYLAGNEQDQVTLQKIVSGPGSAIDRLRAVMRMYLPTGSADAWARDVDAWSEGLYTDEIRVACRHNDERWRKAFRDLIAEGVAAGECQSDNPAEAALRITVMLDGLAVASQVRDTVSRELAVVWAAEHAAYVLEVSPELLVPAATDAEPVRAADAPGPGQSAGAGGPAQPAGGGADPTPISPRVALESDRVRLYR